MLRILTPSLGVIALLTTSGSFALSIIFAVELSHTKSPQRIPAITASALLLTDLGALTLSILQHARNHEKMGIERKTSFIFLAALALNWIFAISAMLATVVWMELCLNELPTNILGSPISSSLVAGFVLCGGLALFQGTYLVLLGVRARRSTLNLGARHADIERSVSMQHTERPMPAFGHYLDSAPSSPSSPFSNRRRSNSDTFSSIRSSLSQSIRPMTSKTRLISRLPSTKSSRSSLREGRHIPPAINTNLSTIPSYTAAVEDGFDTWDTSAVSQDSRQTISDSSPQSPFAAISLQRTSTIAPAPFSFSMPPPTLSHSHSRTFLPTIPASPVVSRTPSPAFALDPPFKPISHRSNRRSQSPANSSHSNTSTRRRSTLINPPPIADPAEAHIHPLFRSDSPTPAPAVSTPGTTVTAAPNAGQLITEFDRASLRRMRSESFTSSPQLKSSFNRVDSFDTIHDADRRQQQQVQQQQLLDGANRRLLLQMERETERSISSSRGEERDSMASEETEVGRESDSRRSKNSSFESEEEELEWKPAPVPSSWFTPKFPSG